MIGRPCRVVLAALLAAGAALAPSHAAVATAESAPAAGGSPRPNIVFLLADDMRADAMSCAGNPVLRTPELDRLAAEGLRFTDAFVTTAICATSRASILTGQYARRHGVNDFRTTLRDLDATYPMRLKRAGYYVGFAGKWGVGDTENDWFGRCARSFDFWAGDTGQSSFWHARTCNYVRNNGTTERERFACDCPAAARAAEGVDPAAGGGNFYFRTGGEPMLDSGGPHPALKDPVHTETFVFPKKLRQFLDARPADKPFCLSLSFKAAHAPWDGYDTPFANAFAGQDLPKAPSVSLADAERQPAFLRQSLAAPFGLAMAQRDDLRLREQRKYYRLVLTLDAAIGAIRSELASRGLAGNTVIVFTSDHGHLLGEHGFFGKWTMFEESIRVPFIIADPRVPAELRGRTSDAMALNIDVAPTLLDLAGVPVPAEMQGKSLVPLLADARAPLRDDFFYEHLYAHGPNPPSHIERSEGVRTRDWKYIDYPDQTGAGREQLFDVRGDPLERADLAADPAHADRLATMRAAAAAYRESLR
jgi:arylsulfatase A-like enzyme